ncbi:hypothetical protein P167DRAFT_586126 [Morchella conica CCBAS932]|uniref:Uncharacterized protein n=1 Tax=Morchella conica CCBAS932 TaxID=1392247 RepID=A0A3N4L2R4_9PEZI|nr:hypothetical protein P167DRAFT_586126 [Morchella conica CCBAS932]
MPRHLRIQLTADNPPKQHVFELTPQNVETRNPTLEAALESSSKWSQFQGIDVVPYAPIYIPHLLGGRGKASQTKLTIDTHFNTRYIYQCEDCVGLWYCKPLDGWGLETPTEFLKDAETPHVKHSFFAETMVGVAPSTLICLNKLLIASGVAECRDGEHQGLFAVNIIMELEMDFVDVNACSTYVPLWVCTGGKLKDVFRIVAGDKLRGEFRLTQVPRASGFVEETYSYRVAGVENKGLEDLIWFPDLGGEMWLLPFPCVMEKFGEEQKLGARLSGK